MPLPAEIGFLSRHGILPDILTYAAFVARETGAPADAVLLRYGIVSEDAFYRALAAELKMPFLTRPALWRADFPNSIRAGLAPLRPGGRPFVVAPQGAQIPDLLRHPARQWQALAMTTPSRLSRAVLHRQAERIAWQAAERLPMSRPLFSARDGASLAQVAALAMLTGLLCFAGPLVPHHVAAILSIASAPLFLGLVFQRLAACRIRAPLTGPAPARAADAALPIYTIIVPLHREGAVLARLVAAMRRLDYPPTKLDVKFIIEADDEETSHALATTTLPPFIEVIVAPPGLPRTKPRALNVALPLARGEYTVIYDAEDVPERDQLRLAAAAFARAPQIACLQARLTVENTADTWLTRFFTIEYATLFDVINPGLAARHNPLPLGGTSNHFRTSVLHDVLGWDAWNVTEDADLGIRLARAGHRVGDLASSTWEEAPSTIGAWMKQRTRWMKGFMQTCITHSRQPLTALRELGSRRFAGAIIVTFGTVISALGYPAFIGFALWRFSEGSLLATDGILSSALSFYAVALFILGFAAMTISAIVALRRRRLSSLMPLVPLLPFYYGLVSIAAWMALWGLITAPSHWSKTRHGLARTSRDGSAGMPRSTRRGLSGRDR